MVVYHRQNRLLLLFLADDGALVNFGASFLTRSKLVRWQADAIVFVVSTYCTAHTNNSLTMPLCDVDRHRYDDSPSHEKCRGVEPAHGLQ